MTPESERLTCPVCGELYQAALDDWGRITGWLPACDCAIMTGQTGEIDDSGQWTNTITDHREEDE